MNTDVVHLLYRLLVARKYDSCAQHASESLQRNPSVQNAACCNFFLGEIAFALERWAEAITSYSAAYTAVSALQPAPSYDVFMSMRHAEALSQLGRYEEAFALLDERIARRLNDEYRRGGDADLPIELICEATLLHLEYGDIDLACNEFTRAIEYLTRNKSLYDKPCRISWYAMSFGLGSGPGAESDPADPINRCVTYLNFFMQTLVFLGIALFHKHDVKMAASVFRTVKYIDGIDPTTYARSLYNLGVVYFHGAVRKTATEHVPLDVCEENPNFQHAREYFKLAASTSPSFQNKIALTNILRLEGKFREAVSLFADALMQPANVAPGLLHAASVEVANILVQNLHEHSKSIEYYDDAIIGFADLGDTVGECAARLGKIETLVASGSVSSMAEDYLENLLLDVLAKLDGFRRETLVDVSVLSTSVSFSGAPAQGAAPRAVPGATAAQQPSLARLDEGASEEVVVITRQTRRPSLLASDAAPFTPAGQGLRLPGDAFAAAATVAAVPRVSSIDAVYQSKSDPIMKAHVAEPAEGASGDARASSVPCKVTDTAVARLVFFPDTRQEDSDSDSIGATRSMMRVVGAKLSAAIQSLPDRVEPGGSASPEPAIKFAPCSEGAGRERERERELSKDSPPPTSNTTGSDSSIITGNAIVRTIQKTLSGQGPPLSGAGLGAGPVPGPEPDPAAPAALTTLAAPTAPLARAAAPPPPPEPANRVCNKRECRSRLASTLTGLFQLPLSSVHNISDRLVPFLRVNLCFDTALGYQAPYDASPVAMQPESAQDERDFLSLLYTRLGTLLKRASQRSTTLAHAKRCLTTALAINKSCVRALNDLALLLLRENKKDIAIKHLLECIRRDPNHAESFYNIGNILRGDGDYRKACQYYTKAVQLSPTMLDAYMARGTIYAELFRWESAYNDFSRCAELDPHHGVAFCNYLHCKQVLGIYKNVVMDNNRLLAILDAYPVRAPDGQPLAHASSASSLHALRARADAPTLPPLIPFHCYLYPLSPTRIITICEDYARRNRDIAYSLLDREYLNCTLAQGAQGGPGGPGGQGGQPFAAQHPLGASLGPAPGDHGGLPDLPGMHSGDSGYSKSNSFQKPSDDGNANLYTSSGSCMDPLAAQGNPLRRSAPPYGNPAGKPLQELLNRPIKNMFVQFDYSALTRNISRFLQECGSGGFDALDADGKLLCFGAPVSVGFLFDDLNDNSTGHLALGWFRHFDPRFIRTTIYSTCPSDNSPLRGYIKRYCSSFVDFSAREYKGSVVACAQRIVTDEIHVLVSLCQHNVCFEGKILALRPAPVQISFWTHCGTTGGDYIQYVLADSQCVPRTHAFLYTEQIIRMPRCYVCAGHAESMRDLLLDEELFDIIGDMAGWAGPAVRPAGAAADAEDALARLADVPPFKHQRIFDRILISGTSVHYDMFLLRPGQSSSELVTKFAAESMNLSDVDDDVKKVLSSGNLQHVLDTIAPAARRRGGGGGSGGGGGGGQRGSLLSTPHRSSHHLGVSDSGRIQDSNNNLQDLTRVRSINCIQMISSINNLQCHGSTNLLKCPNDQTALMMLQPSSSLTRRHGGCDYWSEIPGSNTALLDAPHTSPLHNRDASGYARVYPTDPVELPLYRDRIRTFYGLPADAFLFCTFNQVYKFDLETVYIACTLLRRIPNSYYALLKFPAASQVNIEACVHEIAPEVADRFIFLDVLSKRTEHIRRYLAFDAFVDTLKCNGSTIVLDALWSGLPVIAYSGSYMLSRVTGSFVRACGCPELICSDVQQVVGLGVRLATDRAFYLHVRRKLYLGRQGFFNTKRWCDEFTLAMTIAYRNWALGFSPATFSVEGALQAIREQNDARQQSSAAHQQLFGREPQKVIFSEKDTKSNDLHV